MLGRIARVAGFLVILAIIAGGVAYLARHEILRIAEGLPPFTHSGGDVRYEMIEMRDGVKLATSIHEPDGEGPWPTVLIRNPYDAANVLMRTWCDRLARYGFACVFQEARGQGGSEGEWEPFVHEPEDGHDMMTWLVDQTDLHDGNIALLGPSYLGGVQWATASIELPEEVKTMIPIVIATDFQKVVYENGMFRLETFAAWAAIMRSRGMFPDGAAEDFKQAIQHQPHIEVDEKFYGGRLPWYREWVTSADREAPLWQRDDFARLMQTPTNLEIPILMIGGWYDLFIGPQMSDWQRLATQSKSHFIVGPWTHILQGNEVMGTPDAQGGMLMWPTVLDWLGHHLRAEPLRQPIGIETYVIGADEWITRSNWPPPTKRMRLRMRDLPKSNGCDGGVLATDPSIIREQVTYDYDPSNPVPTRGGSGLLAFLLPGFEGAPPSNQLQDGLCERDDVLTFHSEPLTKALTIAGEIEIVMTVASTAPDTAFTAKVIEVFDDGRAVNVRDGIASLAYRNASTSAQHYTPGSEESILLKLWPIEWQFQEGSKIRLDVSSSDFPKFHAHPNRAGIWSEQTGSDVAEQKLISARGKPSWVSLPVVD